MYAIIISDLHIGSRFFHFGAFAQFLGAFPEGHDLILNGDVVDRPYATMEASHQRILDMIEGLSFRRKVVWVRGNHDNGYTSKNFGKIEFKPQHNIGNRLLIIHGDGFDDIMPRSRLFMKAFRMMNNLRVKLGAKPVHIAEYAKNWKSFYRVLLNNVASNAAACAEKNGFEAVTCGHTHYPEDRIINGVRYVNTGAWTEFPAFFLRITPYDIMLDKFDHSFKAPRSASEALDKTSSGVGLDNDRPNPSCEFQDIGEIAM